MQENNPAQVVPEVQPVQIVNDQQPKTNSFLIILLSILLFISILIAGFFAYQTQKLVKELALLRTEPTPMANAEPTTEPVATESSEVDPTANWKTYVNPTYKYSLNLPKNWDIGEEVFGGASSKINSNTKISSVGFTNGLSSIQIFYEGDFDHGIDPWQFESKKSINLGGKVAEQSIFKLNGNPIKWFIITVGTIENFRIEASVDTSDLDIFDQILSTFKFTN